MSFNDYIEATRKAESNAIAASSLQTYEGYLNSYKNTMESLENAPPPYPITEEKIRGFLHYKLNVCSNKIEYNTFKLFVASFSHYFMINNLPDVTKNNEFRTYKKSIQRTLGTSPHKDKKPITKEFMIAISQKIDKTIFEEVRFFTAMSFAFYGFLRFSELRNLKMNDIKIENDGICLTITQSKNDPLGKGTLCFISKNEQPHNPYSWFTLLISIKKFSDDHLLFNYSLQTFSRKIKEHLKNIGVKSYYKFSSHSLRKGGANAAAKFGIQDNIIQRHGRWRSTIFMEYTKMERKEAGSIIFALI